MDKKIQKVINTTILVIFFVSSLGINPVLASEKEVPLVRDDNKITNKESIRAINKVSDKEIREVRNENLDFNSLESKISDIAKISGLKGNFSVDKFSGASTYSYNIGLPKARALTPGINIYYNSLNNKHSFLGDSWNLSMSYIGFKPKLGIDNMYIDNEFEISFQGSHEKLINIDNDKYVLEKKVF